MTPSARSRPTLFFVSGGWPGHKLATGCHEYSITTYSRRAGPATNGRSSAPNVIRQRRDAIFAGDSEAYVRHLKNGLSALYAKWRSTLNWPQLVAEAASCKCGALLIFLTQLPFTDALIDVTCRADDWFRYWRTLNPLTSLRLAQTVCDSVTWTAYCYVIRTLVVIDFCTSRDIQWR